MSAKTVWSLGFLGLAMFSAVGLYKLLPPIEAELQERADNALIAAGVDDVTAEVSGLSVYLVMKDGATHPQPKARLKEAADTVLALKADWPERVSAKLPESLRFEINESGGYVYGPVLEAVTAPERKPLTIERIQERLTDAVSGL
ncbi:MAG: hypothetical protein AAGC58_04180 [Asticcacaulis sp.]